MQTLMKFVKPYITATLALTVVLLGYQALARKPGNGPTKPAVIATFDVEKTFNSLNEKKDADAALKKIAGDFQTSASDRAAQIKQYEADLGIHKAGTPKHRELSHKLMDASYQYRGFMEFAQVEIQAESARTLKRIYANMSSAVEKIALENGYAVVFLDDSVAQITGNTEQDITRQISARRLVFTHPEIDITDMLIERMNSEYAARPN